MPRSTETCDTVLDLLEPYVDGELDRSDTARVDAHAAACPACAREMALASRIRSELRSLPRPDLPTAWSGSAASGERIPAREAATSGLLPEYDPPPPATSGSGWWMAAMLVVLLAVAAGFWWLGPGDPGPLRTAEAPAATSAPTTAPVAAGSLSEAELDRAEAEARYALAQLARVTERTGLGLRDDVLHRHILAPTAETFTQSIDSMAETSSGDPR